MRRSCWPRFAAGVQRFAWPVAAALLAVAVPVAALSIPRFGHSVGIVPMMPSNAASTHTLLELQAAFGVGSVFPTSLLVLPAQGAIAEDGLAGWMARSCEALKTIAHGVAVAAEADAPPFTPAAFTGAMILDGNCLPASMGSSMGQWSHVGGPYSATRVQISYDIDPFSTDGQAWLVRLRDAIADPAVSDVASWHVYGSAPIQMDVANITFDRLPLTVALMMAVVFVVIAVSFRSLVAPLRAVFCLLWMLAVTFGLAIFVFQDGMLSFLGWSQLGRRDTGAMTWMSPCMAFPVVVGLGLDYDIFYSERVVEEWKHGHDEKEAVVRALAATANTISAAGVIMVVAFFALLLSATPALNEIAFLLIVGVIIDCFVTTKIIIPCVMSLLGRANFWPRKRRSDLGAFDDDEVALGQAGGADVG